MYNNQTSLKERVPAGFDRFVDPRFCCALARIYPGLVGIINGSPFITALTYGLEVPASPNNNVGSFEHGAVAVSFRVFEV